MDSAIALIPKKISDYLAGADSVIASFEIIIQETFCKLCIFNARVSILLQT